MSEPETTGKAVPGTSDELPADDAAFSPGAQSGPEAPGSEPNAHPADSETTDTSGGVFSGARPTQVQSAPETGWCARCKIEAPARGLCPHCGASTRLRPVEKLITGSPFVDAVLGFLYFCGCFALANYVPLLFQWNFSGYFFWGLAVLLTIQAFVMTSPRFGYRSFGRGLGCVSVLVAVLWLGAFLTCAVTGYNI